MNNKAAIAVLGLLPIFLLASMNLPPKWCFINPEWGCANEIQHSSFQGSSSPTPINPDLQFAFPEENSYATNEIYLSAYMASETYNPDNIKYLAFEYYNEYTDGWELIQGITGDSHSYEWEVAFDTDPLPSGEMFVRIVLRDNYEWQKLIKLYVNEAPVNCFTVENIGGGAMMLDASCSSDPDGTIQEYDWFIDIDNNPIRMQGQTVTVSSGVVPINEEFGITLATVDNWDGQTQKHKLANLPTPSSNFVLTEKTCGCESMDVVNVGQSYKPMRWMPSDNNITLGPYNNINLNNDGPFKIWHNYNVIATLKNKSDPSKCFEGQRVKRTFMIGPAPGIKNDSESIVNPDGSFSLGEKIDCPFNGNKWCDDKYHKPTDVKFYIDQNKIIWLDGPGHGSLKKNWITDFGFTWNANFEARVTGPAGACQCNWDVIMTADVNGNVTSNLLNKVCN